MLRNKPEPTRRWLDLAPGDPVIVIAGKDKGKQGEVLHHPRPAQDRRQGRQHPEAAHQGGSAPRWRAGRAGWDRRLRGRARLLQRDARLPILRPADADQAHHPRVGSARAHLPPLWGAIRARAQDGGSVAVAKAKQAPKKEQAPKAPGTRSEAPPRLLQSYRKTVTQQLTKEFDYGNAMQVPRVDKIVVNIGIGEAKDNDKALDAAVGDVQTITGQKPQLVKAKKSVAAFKLRAGQTVGIKTTLRGRRMWYFLDKLLNVALPRIRDFRGVSPDAFDGRGNYSLGLREQVIFPEIDYDKIDKLRGLEVSIITTAKTDDESRSLLTRLGMPFRKR